MAETETSKNTRRWHSTAMKAVGAVLRPHGYKRYKSNRFLHDDGDMFRILEVSRSLPHDGEIGMSFALTISSREHCEAVGFGDAAECEQSPGAHWIVMMTPDEEMAMFNKDVRHWRVGSDADAERAATEMAKHIQDVYLPLMERLATVDDVVDLIDRKKPLAMTGSPLLEERIERWREHRAAQPGSNSDA